MSSNLNNNNAAPDLGKCIHELFELQASRAPDAVALVFEDQQLSYGQLNARANQVAHYLVKRGVGPETLVGICIERSLEMIVGLLGILKAGGAYLPLDPSNPAERLSGMLADGDVSIALTQAHLRQSLTKYNVEAIALDSDCEGIAQSSENNPENKCSAANLAYVMYTSGSTGVPKGVSIPHRGVVRLVKETNYADFGPEQVFLQFAPLSFDASTFEIWGSLLNGSRLVLMPSGRASLGELGETLKRQAVTTVWLTAGLFQQLAENELENLRGLEQLLAGGDVLSAPHVERVARELGGCQLINGYGPTENTTFTCCYRARTGERFECSVPIGLPVANTTVHILDDKMESVPRGVAGELYIGGDGLARGYLNAAAATAEKFVPNPFSVAAGARLYRTGDLARSLADGNIEFLGRLDQQVKVRGYRIELGEIEAVLARHPAVKECVVLARADQPGGKRLVAYLVAESGANAEHLDARHITQWRRLYDETYQVAANGEPEFDITGWNSSYTGQPIPPEQMREWVDNTVARILELEPRRVLEIGCGTGLLLFRIAPHCESYHGTDFSGTVIEQLGASLRQSTKLDHITLSHREADDFAGLEADSVDVVILNSVVQYFPTIDYLVRVIEGAVRVTRPGGAIFIGDVRNLDLLTEFHASVQMHKATRSLSATELHERVNQAVADEHELVIAPAFFQAASRYFSKTCTARVLSKQGRYQNELTRFRYDAVLAVSAPVGAFRIAGDDARADNKSWGEYVNRRSQKNSLATMVGELRAFLGAKIPDYMMPSAFVFLDRLPLTANGKVDRGALPAPELSRPNLDQEFVAPGDEIEVRLARIWAEVLGIDRVGVRDNFFELGGHSLLATQVCARVRESLKADISLQAFFAEPTVSGLAQKISSEERQQTTTRAIARQPDAATAPLSFGQQRLWFMNQLLPGTPVHNIPAAIPLELRPDVSVLERALNEIVRRHATLRTTIKIVNGQPVQSIAPALELKLPLIELTQLTALEATREAERIKNEEAHAPFDLVNGPLIRGRLLRLSEYRHILLLTMHHIISDGWSMGVLLRELGTIYQALAASQKPPLPELPLQYSDFAIWQRDALSGEPLHKQHSYWQQQLKGASAALQLTTDRPRPPRQSLRGGRLSLVLTPQLSRQANEFSQREGVTLFMTLLAVFNLLLFRLTGQEDINVGSPIVNRSHSDTEGLIGFFLNTLVLRTQLSPGMHFRQLLRQVRENALGAYANQDLPFEMLVEALNPDRDLSRTPLFQVFFNLLNFSDQRLRLPGLTAEYVSPAGVWSQPDESWSQFDLTLYASQTDKELKLILVYNSDLFDRLRMAGMLEQYRDLLEQVVAEPEKPIDAYSLVTSESRLLLPDPAQPLSESRRQPISEVFFERAGELPEQTAIAKGNESWSYGELAARSRAIACGLLRDGLNTGEVVAISGPPSFGLISGMLGVLASGGVLLMLDRNLPALRLRLMLREAGARRLLYVSDETDLETAERFAGETPSSIIMRISEGGYECNGASADSKNLPAPVVDLPQLNPDAAAYLFFTSGTTGTPKGVLGCHKGLSHFLAWQREEFKITPADRAAQLTGLSFDVVLRDIFLPLTSGASLHLPDNPIDVASGRIVSWLERKRITLLHTVPSMAEAWLNDLPADLPKAGTLGALRWAFFAGEPLTDAFVRRWRQCFPTAGKLVNLYGPTETTLAKCYYVVPDEPSFGVQPVGRPLPEAQALVLKQNDLPCGIGEAGEIVIRTPFRTLGYINAAAEQQSRFIKNHFRSKVTQTVSLRDVECLSTEQQAVSLRDVECLSTEQQADSLRYSHTDDLLYRTGDRGRFRPDGELEIMGRLDDQIKIRGVRIEPAEVASVLARHPFVGSCIVLPCKNAQGENALVAYLVMKDKQSVAPLRAWLGTQLPPAMLPAWFVSLETLPLTPNGKVDRRALPEPDRFPPEVEQEFVGPRNRNEEIVAGIWSEVLSIDRISVVRNFFELGGHSLLATQIISRMRDAFQAELPLSSIFESPTVAALAELIAEAQKHSAGSTPVIRALPRKRRRPTV